MNGSPLLERDAGVRGRGMHEIRVEIWGEVDLAAVIVSSYVTMS